MIERFVKTTDLENNELIINTNPVYILKHSFDVKKHLEYLYRENTKKVLKIA